MFKQLVALAAIVTLAVALPARADEASSVGKLWGLTFTDTRYVPAVSQWIRVDDSQAWLAQGAVVVDRNGKNSKPTTQYKIEMNYYWSTQSTFTGDGTMKDLGEGRLMYRVPTGRMLVINRLHNAGRAAINGFPISSEPVVMMNRDSTPIVAETVNYVFGPEETVIFTFDQQTGLRPAQLSGYTADPALFGGSAGGVEAGGASK